MYVQSGHIIMTLKSIGPYRHSKKKFMGENKMANCFFIGHRVAPSDLCPLLDEAVKRHIVEFGVTQFTVGQYGDFDRYAAQAVKKAKKSYPEVMLTLLLPYHPFDRPVAVPDEFDDTCYPLGLEFVPKRAAIIRADQYMIKTSDYLIAYDCGLAGNTKSLVSLARRREKKGMIRIENLADRT